MTTVRCWVVELINEPRLFIYADRLIVVPDRNLVFTLDGALVRSFARDTYFDVSLAEEAS